jgi:hypothetical protein
LIVTTNKTIQFQNKNETNLQSFGKVDVTIRKSRGAPFVHKIEILEVKNENTNFNQLQMIILLV